MSTLSYFEEQWKYLLTMLPKVDLEATARVDGAFVRPRVIRTAETLLRIILAYCCCEKSLRDTSQWAAEQGLGSLSQVAVLKCLRRSANWMNRLLSAKLAERVGAVHLGGLRLRLLDATTVSAPGSQGTDWRVHMGFDLSSMSIDSLEVTGSEGGESLSRFHLQKDEVVIADRGYAHRRGLWSVVQAEAYFLIRLNWHNLPLQTLQGEVFDLMGALRQVGEAAATEFAVQTTPAQGIAAIQSRLVALRKSPAAAEHSRQKILQQAKKKGRQVHPSTLEAAGYIFVLTSIPAQILAAAQVLEMYRLRWQIEMAFKRFKGILPLRQVPAKDPDVARTYLFANLLAALLIEDLTRNFLALSPWGYRL